MSGALLPVALPVTVGTTEHGFNANVLYDANDSSIATLFGIPNSMSREQLAKAVEARDFNGAWVAGAARADYIAHAMNAFPVLVQAVQAQHQAIDALLARVIQLDPKFMPSESAAWSAVKQGQAALAAAMGEPNPRWGWGSIPGGVLCTSEGAFKLVAEDPANQEGAEAVARYIADAVTLLHHLGGTGL